MKKIKAILLIFTAVILVGVFIYGFSLLFKSFLDNKQVDKVRPAVVKELNLKDGDYLRGCLNDFDESMVIFSINHRDYFTYQNNQLKIIDLMNKKTKIQYPDLELDNSFLNFYWLLENCK